MFLCFLWNLFQIKSFKTLCYIFLFPYQEGAAHKLKPYPTQAHWDHNPCLPLPNPKLHCSHQFQWWNTHNITVWILLEGVPSVRRTMPHETSSQIGVKLQPSPWEAGGRIHWGRWPWGNIQTPIFHNQVVPDLMTREDIDHLVEEVLKVDKEAHPRLSQRGCRPPIFLHALLSF